MLMQMLTYISVMMMMMMVCESAAFSWCSGGIVRQLITKGQEQTLETIVHTYKYTRVRTHHSHLQKVWRVDRFVGRCSSGTKATILSFLLNKTVRM